MAFDIKCVVCGEQKTFLGKVCVWEHQGGESSEEMYLCFVCDFLMENG